MINPHAFTLFLMSSFFIGVSFTTSFFYFLLDIENNIIINRNKFNYICNENNITII
jgi:hypothetical protein